MEIERSSAGDVQVVRVKGRLDSSSSAAFEAQVLPAIRPGANRVVLDFSALDYVSSAGLRAVLLTAKQTRATQGGFAIFGMAAPVHQVFKMSGFARIIPLFDTEAEAVHSAAG
jgi:anti-anti-sigma factor